MNNEKLEEIKKPDSLFLTLMKGTLNGVIADNQDKFNEAFEKTLATYKSLKVDSMFSDEEINDIKNWLMTYEIQINIPINHIKDSQWWVHFTGDKFYWNRYKEYLQNKNWNNIDGLDKVTDDIINLIGNPKSEEFDCRGLVMGDVQSGKTATYTAICNKAIDAGYDIVIILAGTKNDLRRQTQERLDKDLIGQDTGASEFKPIGVGLTSYSKEHNNDIERHIASITTVADDFKGNQSLNLGNPKRTLLVVTKKNVYSLNNIIDDLRLANQPDLQSSDKLNYSLLLIDDEADNASINTKSNNKKKVNNQSEETVIDFDNITAINRSIRELLVLFKKSTYVGISATPFANIFINPEDLKAKAVGQVINNDKQIIVEKIVNQDLFPKDFIRLLEAPTNYIGAEKIFKTDSECAYMIVNNKSINEEEATLTVLNEDMKDAICYFILANAILEAQNSSLKHRTMLINFSHKKDDHKQLKSEVEAFLKTDIINKEKDRFEKLFKEEIENKNIKTTLNIDDFFKKTMLSLEVKVINSDKDAESFIDYYNKYREKGFRGIAIGGYSFSRGMTLEGLCTTYLDRNSKAYDTLLQMGRWFGYRDGYKEICRVWMPKEMKESYEEITKAVSELKDDIRKMNSDNKKPDEVVMKIRQSKGMELYVTAISKQGIAKSVEIGETDFNGKLIETAYLNINDIGKNEELIKQFINGLEQQPIKLEKESRTGGYIWKNISKSKIIDIATAFKIDNSSRGKFNNEKIVDYINKYTNDNWDVVVVNQKINKEDSTTYKDFKCGEIKLYGRNFDVSGNQISLKNKTEKIGILGVTSAGLEPDKLKEIWGDKDKNNMANEAYLTENRNPILIVYVEKILNYNELVNVNPNLPDKIFALGFGFPKSKNVASNKEVPYLVATNNV